MSLFFLFLYIFVKYHQVPPSLHSIRLSALVHALCRTPSAAFITVVVCNKCDRHGHFRCGQTGHYSLRDLVRSGGAHTRGGAGLGDSDDHMTRLGTATTT